MFILWVSLIAASTFASDPGTNSNLNPLSAELVGKKCEIYRDPQGIPHLHARDTGAGNSELIGFACLGYIHAKDRGWEMDYFRRTVQGRKAEIFGQDAIQSDFFMRLLGLEEKADSLFIQLDKRYKDYLWAYAWGANQGFGEALKKGVYEFQGLGYTPDAWKPQDSLAVMLLQSFDQTRRTFQLQFDQKNWLKEYGSDADRLFSFDGLPWDTSILKSGEYQSRAEGRPEISAEIPENEKGNTTSNRPVSGALENNMHADIQNFFKQLSTPWDGPGTGSNNWVIDSSKSKTGNAWLANDPHLKLARPPFWHWVHMDAGTMDVIGATLPGVPVFASASNHHVSWGLTNSFVPVAKVTYVPVQDLTHAKAFRPWIWVRLWNLKLPFFFKSFQRTESGLPILPLAAPDGTAIVLRWTGFDLSAKDISGLMEIEKIHNVIEADHLLSTIRVPSWNFVFADDNGHIGYRTNGRTPRYNKEPALGIGQESLSQLESSVAFSNPLTADEMPHVLNPKRGYVVTANNRQWPSNSRYSLGNAQSQGLRAFRIEELIRALGPGGSGGQSKKGGLGSRSGGQTGGQIGGLDLASNQRIQCDIQAVDARFLLPKLLAVLDASRGSNQDSVHASGHDSGHDSISAMNQPAIQALRDWNFETDVNCKACALYRRWVERIYSDQTLNEVSLYKKLSEESGSPESPGSEGSRRSSSSPGSQGSMGSPGFNEKNLDFKKSVLKAFEMALEDIGYSKTHQLPAWGSVHLNAFHHLAGNSYFEVKPISTPGDAQSVNPGNMEWNGQTFDHTAGASQRLIVEMSKPPKIYLVLAGSNMDDNERPDISKEGSDWNNWLNCKIRQQEFPVDWSKVEGSIERVGL